MREILSVRSEEGKTSVAEGDVGKSAEIIGYGAVKYFDLKQHPATNYIFSYERMLDTKGDTAVYLLFAYARLASILRKVRLLIINFKFLSSTICRRKKREESMLTNWLRMPR